jgi:hypothetical protein
MFGSTILEVALGLVLVYLLLSLICTALKETLEAYLKIRATCLEQGLRVLLQDPDGKQLLQSLYAHPLIDGLFNGDYNPATVRSKTTSNLPSYIPSASFATALVDIIVRGPVGNPAGKTIPTGAITIDILRTAVTNSTTLNPSVQRIMVLMLDSANGDLTKVQANIETWFNSAMDRVSGWYKRQTQWILLLIGLVVTVSMNVDTLKVTRELYHNDTLRAVVVAQAETAGKKEAPPAANAHEQARMLNELKLPIGWQEFEPAPVSCKSVQEFFHIARSSFVGWLITAIAISFGAPFWFDLLNKIISIRSSVKPQAKTPAGSTGTK